MRRVPHIAALLVMGCVGSTTTIGAPHLIGGSVSGAVRAGVTLTLGGGSSGTTTTNGTGAYTFIGLADGTYVVTPSLAGYTFAPTSHTVTVSGENQTGQDFVATAVATPTYSIAGHVTGAVSSGVILALTGGSITTTDGSGAYAFAGLADGTYVVTPFLTGYAFAPPSLTVTVSGWNQTGQDFVATAIVAPTYSIAGHVTGAASSGVTLALTGGATTTTDDTGAYAFTGLADGTYDVTPSLAGYAFAPPSLTVTVSSRNQVGQDFVATAVTAPTYSITGEVTGAVLWGVTMTVTGRMTRTAMTGSGGGYSLDRLGEGSYVVTPSCAGYVFSPPSVQVEVKGGHQTGANFTSATAAIPAITITGTVGGPSASGVQVVLTGWNMRVATSTDASGNYEFKVSRDGDYSVTPFWSGVLFAPSRAQVTVSGTSQAGIDFTSVLPTSGATSSLRLTSTNPAPGAIVAGPNGDMWVTEDGEDKIVRISTDGSISVFSLPAGHGISDGLTVGPDGALWFTEPSRVGRLAADGTMTEFLLPVANDWPRGITTGPDGNLWFVASSARVYRMTPDGVFTLFPVDNTSALIGITTGPDGNLWFTEYDRGWVGRITTAGVVTQFPVTGGPRQIVAGPDGNIWFAESEKVGRITPAGVVTEYTLVGRYPRGASGIVVGPDGNIWFTETDMIGRITPDGVITEYPVASDGTEFLAFGPDGQVWYPLAYTSTIGHLTP